MNCLSVDDFGITSVVTSAYNVQIMICQHAVCFWFCFVSFRIFIQRWRLFMFEVVYLHQTFIDRDVPNLINAHIFDLSTYQMWLQVIDLRTYMFEMYNFRQTFKNFMSLEIIWNESQKSRTRSSFIIKKDTNKYNVILFLHLEVFLL